MTNSIGSISKTEILISTQLGTVSEPIELINEKGKINMLDNISYIDNNTGNEKFELDNDGTLKLTGQSKLYNLNNILTGSDLFRWGLNNVENYVLHTTIPNIDSITINKNTGVITFLPVIPSNPIQPLYLQTGNNLTGGNVQFDGSQIITFLVQDNGISINSPLTLVMRDSLGNFGAGVISASLSGNATTSTSSTNILGGSLGNLVVQTGSGSTSFISNGSINQVLISQGAASLPIWSTATVVNDGTLQIDTGTHLNGGPVQFTANQSGNSNIIISTDATNLNTASTIISRDSNGDFNCGVITGSLNGNSTTSSSTINLLGGSAGSIPYQSSISNTGFTAVGTLGQILTSSGSGSPIWTTITLPSNATITIATSNHLSGGSSFLLDQVGNQTITLLSDATSSNTASTIISRDFNGDFSSGIVTSPQVISLTDLVLNAGISNLIQIQQNTNFNNKLITAVNSLSGNNNTNLNINGIGTGSITLNTNSTSRLSINSSGATTISGSLKLNSTLIDASSSAGAAGSILSSLGTATSWIAQSSLVAGSTTNLVGGTAGSVPYQSAVSTTGFSAAGTAGQLLTSSGGGAPTWTANAALKPPFAYYSGNPYPNPQIAGNGATYTLDFLGTNAYNGMPYIIPSLKYCDLPQTGFYKVTARAQIGQSAFVVAAVNSYYIQILINGTVSMQENYGTVTPTNNYGAFPQVSYFQLITDTIVSVSALTGGLNRLSVRITSQAGTGPTDVFQQAITIHKISDV